MSEIIAVDFDGTLTLERTYPEIGTPNLILINYLKELQEKEGVHLILNTCRRGEPLKAAVEFCKEHGLEFDAVNENLPSVVKKHGGNDTRKVVASYYIDDRAINAHELTNALWARSSVFTAPDNHQWRLYNDLYSRLKDHIKAYDAEPFNLLLCDKYYKISGRTITRTGTGTACETKCFIQCIRSSEGPAPIPSGIYFIKEECAESALKYVVLPFIKAHPEYEWRDI